MGIDKPDIVESPYMPPGFVASKDRRGTHVLDIKTGAVFTIPPFTLETKLSDRVELSEDSMKFYIDMMLRFDNPPQFGRPVDAI
jgi:hypothetical protein